MKLIAWITRANEKGNIDNYLALVSAVFLLLSIYVFSNYWIPMAIGFVIGVLSNLVKSLNYQWDNGQLINRKNGKPFTHLFLMFLLSIVFFLYLQGWQYISCLLTTEPMHSSSLGSMPALLISYVIGASIIDAFVFAPRKRG